MQSRPDLATNDTNREKLIDLFVLSLPLTFVSLRKMFKSVSTFTIAHSDTLILAGLSIVTLNTQVVESMIALSIAVALYRFVERAFGL